MMCGMYICRTTNVHNTGINNLLYFPNKKCTKNNPTSCQLIITEMEGFSSVQF